MKIQVCKHCYFISALTVLPAKSDSDFMFYLQNIRDLKSIDHFCINPFLRIGLIHT